MYMRGSTTIQPCISYRLWGTRFLPLRPLPPPPRGPSRARSSQQYLSRLRISSWSISSAFNASHHPSSPPTTLHPPNYSSRSSSEGAHSKSATSNIPAPKIFLLHMVSTSGDNDNDSPCRIPSSAGISIAPPHQDSTKVSTACRPPRLPSLPPAPPGPNPQAEPPPPAKQTFQCQLVYPWGGASTLICI